MEIFHALHFTGFSLIMSLTLTLEIKFYQRKFSNKVIGITKSVKRFQNSIDVTMTWFQILILKSLLKQGLSEPEFYGD